MSGPDLKLLNNILDLYLVYDKKKEVNEIADNPLPKDTTFMQKMTGYAMSLAQYAFGQDTIEEELTKICDDVRKELKEEKSPKDWILLALKLGEYAEKAQSVQKSPVVPFTNPKQSRCCEVLHMIRNQIVVAMQRDKGEYRKMLDEKITKLLKRKNHFQESYVQETEKNRNTAANEMLQKRNKTLKQLAYLQCKEGITLSYQLGLIAYLYMVPEREKQFASERSVVHFTFNPQLPYLMQDEAAFNLYRDKYQILTSKSYEEFGKYGIPPTAEVPTKSYLASEIDEPAVIFNEGSIGGITMFSQSPTTRIYNGSVETQAFKK